VLQLSGIVSELCRFDFVAFSLRAKARILRLSAFADSEPVSTSPENAPVE
jgi:hypothetical protein